MSIKSKKLVITEKIQQLQKEISRTRKSSDKLLILSNEYRIKLFELREEVRKLEMELIEVSRLEKLDNPPL